MIVTPWRCTVHDVLKSPKGVPDAAAAVARQKLAELVGRLGSQGAVAKACGLHPTAVSNYVNGNKPISWAAAYRIAKSGAMALDEVLGLPVRHRPAKPDVGPDQSKAQRWTYLPKVGWTAAGEPIDYTVPEDEFTWYAFHRSWAEQMTARDAPDDQQRLVMIEVGEDQESMWPTLRPGAVLVVDRGADGRGIQHLEDIRPGRIYLCRIPGTEGVTAKFVSVDRGMGVLVLTSDNPDREKYSPRLVPLRGLELQRVLLGLVIHVGQDLAPRRRNLKRHSADARATKEHLVGLVEKAGGKAK